MVNMLQVVSEHSFGAWELACAHAVIAPNSPNFSLMTQLGEILRPLWMKEIF
jgi:hypothetical protein